MSKQLIDFSAISPSFRSGTPTISLSDTKISIGRTSFEHLFGVVDVYPDNVYLDFYFEDKQLYIKPNLTETKQGVKLKWTSSGLFMAYNSTASRYLKSILKADEIKNLICLIANKLDDETYPVIHTFKKGGKNA